MFRDVIGHRAVKNKDGVLLTKVRSGQSSSIQATDWDMAVDWLTNDSEAFQVVWDLREFTDILFTLLPKSARDKLRESSKVSHNNTKVFYAVNRMLALTTMKHLNGNTYDRVENEFYGLRLWMIGVEPPVEPPDDVFAVASYGEQVVEALEVLRQFPTRLTSPAGAFTQSLINLDLPTVFSNENDAFYEACDYCLPIMRNEWRSAYKIGFFDKAWVYDMVSAYPSIMAGLPNTDKCQIIHSDQYVKSDWGIMKGKVEILADISPIVLDTVDGHINPSGEWATQMTVDEAIWLKKNGVGRFTMDDGYFFRWLSREKPYEKIMSRLFTLRQSNEGLAQSIAKNMAQGCSGKLDQDNPDGSFGELYNPILACITRSRCRLKVADFIYANKLQDDLVAVIVDGCLTTKPVEIKPTGEMGSWRLDSESSALVLGKGGIWRQTKRPFGVTFDDITKAMREHPTRSYYQFGKKELDLAMEETNTDRVYNGYPQNGGEALSKIFGSKPIIAKGGEGK